MIRKFGRILKRFFKYPKIIGEFGLCLCILDEILKREVVRIITISGVKIYVRTNMQDLNVAITCFYDKEYDHIRLSNPKVIIDAGANIGTSAIFFAEKYPNARIIAVEPEKSNFDLLLKNTSNYKNIVAIKAAIWGTNDKRTIQNRFAGPVGYTISDTSNKIESTGQEINCITIETLMKKHNIETIDLLKMDIEGSEKDVLEKSLGWIDSVDTMTVELHDRICMGCVRAFYLSTKDFKIFEKHGEKVTAYRN